jgi:pyruvate/oxaloacetate carboxyltransferase
MLGIEHNLNTAAILQAQENLFTIYDELADVIPGHGKYYAPVDPDAIDRRKVESILNLLEKGDAPALEAAIDETRALLRGLQYPPHDPRIFESQIPGGMLSNLQNQLREMQQPDILPQVMAEIPVVRRDVGYVPLVTPTSQIVGSQAVFNIVSGQRYSFVSEEFKMLLCGEFGRTPIPPNRALVETVLDDSHVLKKYRPAAYLMPVLEDVETPPFVHNQQELLLHLLLGASADKFLQQQAAAG